MTPAPLNQKDIVEDFLFELIFDSYNGYMEEKQEVLGFMNGYPAILKWSFDSNEIDIYAITYDMTESEKDAAIQGIDRKLDEVSKEIKADDGGTFFKEDKFPDGHFHLSFYYKE